MPSSTQPDYGKHDDHDEQFYVSANLFLVKCSSQVLRYFEAAPSGINVNLYLRDPRHISDCDSSTTNDGLKFDPMRRVVVTVAAFAVGFIVLVIAGKPFDMTVPFERQNMRRYAIQKPPIV
ncbi:MAG: hypothetical protein ACI9BW_002478 [Gammaproteobacteria bacterium]|jgi:hypothetical protein